MANNEELGRLSPEQLQKLAGTISEAKNLTSQQEEIIKKVLAGEVEVGNLRIAYLNQYFDQYSKRLDQIIARKTSALNDTFLVIDQKLGEEFKALSSNISEFSSTVSKSTTSNDTKSKSGKRTDSLDSFGINQYINNSISSTKKGFKTLEDLRTVYLDKLVALEKRNAESRLSLEFARSKQEEDLWLRSTEFQLSKIKEVVAAQLSVQQKIDDTDTQLDYTSTKKGQKEIGRMHADVVNAKAELEAREAIEKEIIDIRKRLEDEARAKHKGKLLKKDAADIEAQINTEHTNRLKKLKQLTEERFKSEARLRALSDLKQADPALADKLEAKRIERKQALELEAMRRNNGKITEELRKAINKTLDEEFDIRSEKGIKLIEELGKAQLANAELARLKENDPGLYEQFDKERIKRKRQLELEAMRSNNGIITEEARSSIDEKLKIESDPSTEQNIKLLEDLGKKQLVDAELASLKENDPAMAADAEARIKQEIADLEYQYRQEHNNELNAQAIKDIEYQAKQRVLQDKEGLKQLAAERAFYEANPAAKAELDKKQAKLLAQYELDARLANDNKYTDKQKKDVEKRVKNEAKLTEQEQAKLDEKRIKQLKKQIKDAEKEERNEKKRERQAQKAEDEANTSTIISKGQTLEDRISAAKDLADSRGGLGAITKVLGSLAKLLEDRVDKIAESKSAIDTRLQGSNNKTASGSYWDRLTKDMMSVGAITPYFKQEKFAENIKSLVDTGIAFDLKQRAFLMTIQEKIANTFEVADGTLLRLVRIQQEDSTAGRLGMESALNSFLNNMYENTEYLKTVAAGVRSSLQEMEALMSGAEATEVEYQVQKWMGSLYSVGMSQEAVNNIAAALGQIAAGQVDALTSGNGAGNLMVMAANEAGIPISDILASGLNAKETNKLLQATVNYLAELAESSKDNQVVQQQLASVFGVKASDLRAATNLSDSKTNQSIYGEYLTYDNMLRQLYKMAGTMGQRTSLGEMMSNVWANGMYTLAGSMASNPISYLLYKGATLLDDTVGGIDFSIPMVMGTGTAQTFNVADLIRIGALSGGILGSIGPIISGLSSSFNGQAMLAKMGIDSGSGLTVTPRGSAGGVGALAGGGGQTTSGSGYVGNSSGSDIKNSTIQQQEDDTKKQVIEAKEEAEATQIDFINVNVLKIYELLDDVANGKRSLNVKVSGYGLTNLGSNTSLSGAQGGVASLLSNKAANNSFGDSEGLSNGFSNSGSSSGASSTGSSDSFGASSGINLGGWTIV